MFHVGSKTRRTVFWDRLLWPADTRLQPGRQSVERNRRQGRGGNANLPRFRHSSL